MLYYKNEKLGEPLGVILLKEMSIEQDIEVEPNTFILRIKTSGKDYILKAASYEEGKKWAEAIEAKLLANRGSISQAPSLNEDDD